MKTGAFSIIKLSRVRGIFLILIALNSALFVIPQTLAQTDTDQFPTHLLDSRLQTAYQAATEAFNAVLDAENAGANVTALITQLNDAYSLLNQANLAYQNGNQTDAENKASTVISTCHQVLDEAQLAQQNASTAYSSAFSLTITATFIALIVFALAAFFMWRWFRNRYLRNLSSAKPEVIDYEA
jgi:hypothetical protein